MSEPKMVSEREAVLRERDAFRAGAHYGFVLGTQNYIRITPESAAAKRYPLPTVTRPRVARGSDGYEWSIRDGHMRFRVRGSDGEWLRPDGHEGGAFEPTLDRVQMWADLLANPTEVAEDDS